MSNAEDQILKAIEILVDARVQNAPLDRTVHGKIAKRLAEKKYLVEINHNMYTVPSYGNYPYAVGDIVWVRIPNGNFNDRFLLPKPALLEWSAYV